MEFSADTLGSRIKANRVHLLLAALGFTPLLWDFFALAWKRPAYQFFPMALVAAALLARRAAPPAGLPVAPGTPGVNRWLVLAAVLVCLGANALWSPWLAFAAVLLGLAAVLWGLGGRPLLRAWTPAGLMLLAIMPPPLHLDERLTVWLRSVAVQASGGLLDWLGVTFVQDGNTLQLPGKTLFVEEACSGINSFVLCNVFCLFLCLWRRRPVWWLPPALFAASLFVVLGNVLRITLCTAADFFWHQDLLAGWRHETLGLVLLLGYCGLILSFDQCLVWLFPSGAAPALWPDPRRVKKAPPASARALPPAPARPLLGFKLTGVFFAVLGLGVFAAHLLLGRDQVLMPMPGLHASPVLKLSLPDRLAGWQRINPVSGDQSLVRTAGVHSDSWHFQRDGAQAMVAVDYPLDGFHNVKICYVDNGWRVQAEEALVNPRSHEDLHALRLTLYQDIRHALVFHSVLDQRGDWLCGQLTLSGRFVYTGQILSGSLVNSAPPTGYRIQLITGGYAPISAATAAAARDLFFQARQVLVPQITARLRPGATP
jgi:exosortase